MTDAPARIDAHQHFWDLSTGAYDWPTAAEGPIFRSFAPADLAPELRAAGIEGTVLVQTTDTLADTHAMIDAADENPWIAGIVGWVPVDDERGMERALEAIAAKRAVGLCGVRHLIHREVDPDWILRPDVDAGLRRLSAAGLPFDVVAVFPNHLRHVPAIADRHPDLTLVVDHLAKPPIRGAGWDVWRQELGQAAARPNVTAKISGLDTAAGPGWTADELRPSVEVAIEAFGPERLLFGSDWPVCRLVSTYGALVSAAEALIAGLSDTERAAIMGGTARRVYGLA